MTTCLQVALNWPRYVQIVAFNHVLGKIGLQENQISAHCLRCTGWLLQLSLMKVKFLYTFSLPYHIFADKYSMRGRIRFRKCNTTIVFTPAQPGSVCLETSDQHKIVKGMTVDHKSMWRRTQILTYIVSFSVIPE